MTPLARLEPEYEVLKEEAQSFAATLEEISAEADGSNDVHPGVLEALRRSGLTKLTVPAELGGRHERIDPLAVTLVREALMSVSSHADSLFALQGIGSYAITASGSEAQRKEWLPRVATAEVLAAFAVTEAEAGSDLKGLRTTARLGREGSVTLDGTKTFISNAGAAGFYTVLAREDDGYSTFLVPADSSGLTVTPAPELGAPHVLGDLRLEGVNLPADSRIGPPGAGLKNALSTLAVFRVSVAGAAVGLAQRALDEATRHAIEREQFGKKLVRIGPVAGLLADSWADVASARLLTYQAARLAKQDPLANLEFSSLAKLAASEACGRVVDRCVQVMGRWGLIKDSRIDRCYRQARPMRIYEGASEVLRLGVAKRLAEEYR